MQAQIQTALQCLQTGQFAQAVNILNPLSNSAPNNTAVLTMLSAAQREIGQIPEALDNIGKALKIDPNYAKGHMHHGITLLKSGQPEAAVRAFEIAERLLPEDPEIVTLLGRAYCENVQYGNSQKAFGKAIHLAPNFVEAYFGRAILASKNNDFRQLLNDVQKCEELGRNNVETLLLKAQALSGLNDSDKALECISQAESLSPNNQNIINERLRILQSLGKFDVVKEHLLEIIEQHPTRGNTYVTYGRSHKFTADDSVLEQMQNVLSSHDLDVEDEINIRFALSKALEDVGQFSDSFAHLGSAKKLLREKYNYDESTAKNEISTTKSMFKDFADHGVVDISPSDTNPIFVLGLPRSGTTLTEQILTSHSRVESIGEAGLITRAADFLFNKYKGRSWNAISAADIETMQQGYIERLRALQEKGTYIVDKTVNLHSAIGLIWMALPNAKIIVVRRDPKDNLLSIYKNQFAEGTHRYSYNLLNLADHYRMFVEMIDFWRDVNPDGFHEIWYEDLTSSPEEESRKLVTAAGLEWEDACLNFHQNKRKVNTLSLYQVRQPIYKSSVKAWQRYEKELQPLFERLSDLAEPKR